MLFHWVITPFLVSIVISGLLGTYALKRPEVPTARVFGWLMLALTLWTLSYVMAFSSTSIETKTSWTQLKYLGATAGPALWFMLAFKLTDHNEWLTRPVLTLIWGWVVVIFLGVLSNDWHHLFWQELRLIPGLIEAQSVHGVMFTAYGAVLYLFFLCSGLLYWDFYRRTTRIYRRQALVFFLAGLTPILGHILDSVFDIQFMDQVDQVPLCLLVSTLLFGYAIFRFNAMELLPIAHDQVIKSIQAGIVVLDSTQRVIDINPFARGLTNHPEPIGKHVNNVFSGSENLDFLQEPELDVQIDVNGEQRWIHLTVSQLSDDTTLGYVLVGHDITPMKKAEAALAIQATTDPLTGARNRRSFYEMAKLEISRAKRQSQPLGVIMADIDFFKRVNDSHGHRVGDGVLIEAVQRCQRLLRDIDIFARFGGEEFVVLLTGSIDGINQTAERLRAEFEDTPFVVDDVTLNITLSVGVAHLCAKGESIDDLINNADKALYQAKQNGRNQVIAI